MSNKEYSVGERMFDEDYSIDVDESDIHAVECVAEDCSSITMGVFYNPQYCAACGVNLTMHGIFDDDESDE